jgi:hypothetical protein
MVSKKSSIARKHETGRQSFTGSKLDWMNAVSADPKLDARAFEVAFCIAQHVNQDTGQAFLSDHTICDKTGIPKRWVLRARKSLRDAGWINWKRTKTANVYWTLGERIDAISEHQLVLKAAREDRRIEARSTRVETPPVAYLVRRDMPSVAQPQTPSMANSDVPPTANVHLSNHTLVGTHGPPRVESFQNFLNRK